MRHVDVFIIALATRARACVYVCGARTDKVPADLQCIVFVIQNQTTHVWESLFGFMGARVQNSAQ